MGFALCGIAAALGMRSPMGLLTYGMAGMASGVSIQEILRPARIRSAKRKESYPIAFVRSFGKNYRRVGGHLAHLGVFLMAVSIASAESHRLDTRAALTQNVPQEVFGYNLTYTASEKVQQPHRVSDIARIQVGQNGRSMGELSPRDNTYISGNMAGQKIGTPAVRSGLKEDLYVTLLRVDPSGGAKIASIRVIVQPMVKWIWMGGLLMVAGGLLAAWPKREAKAA